MALRVLDMYCGAGGSSRGANMAGAEIACGVDTNPLALSVYEDNFPGRAFHAHVSSDFNPASLDPYGPFDVILASPECRSHTCARGNKPGEEESRLTAMHTLRVIERFRPRWVIFENVFHMRSWTYYKTFLQKLTSDYGFQISEQILNSVDFGVPQSRRRLFILCDTEAPPTNVEPNTDVPVPASEILDPSGTWKAGLATPDRLAEATIKRIMNGVRSLGEGVPFITVYYGSDNAGGWQPLERPLRTVTTVDRFGLVDYAGSDRTLRMLQVSELRRAMGFPIEHRLDRGNRRQRIHFLGNAVCPPVMAAAFRDLTSSI
jgi:DNA (cytosine-5)-methyltransferase 1